MTRHAPTVSSSFDPKHKIVSAMKKQYKTLTRNMIKRTSSFTSSREQSDQQHQLAQRNQPYKEQQHQREDEEDTHLENDDTLSIASKLSSIADASFGPENVLFTSSSSSLLNTCSRQQQQTPSLETRPRRRFDVLKGADVWKIAQSLLYQINGDQQPLLSLVNVPVVVPNGESGEGDSCFPQPRTTEQESPAVAVNADEYYCSDDEEEDDEKITLNDIASLELSLKSMSRQRAAATNNQTNNAQRQPYIVTLDDFQQVLQSTDLWTEDELEKAFSHIAHVASTAEQEDENYGERLCSKNEHVLVYYPDFIAAAQHYLGRMEI